MMNLKELFAGCEQYVEVVSDEEIRVIDFLYFTEDWDEIYQEIPDEVMDLVAECYEKGIEVDYSSMDI